ncbi:MAG: hypothetical protein U0J29_09620 [Ruminococcus sp.]|nr:hypothetical protein [Ruminococcus sp.]
MFLPQVFENLLKRSIRFFDVRGKEIGCNIRAAGNQKFFDPTIFQKCWRGVGEQPTFAKQIEFCNLFFLLQLHFLKLTNSLFNCLYETSCKFRQGNGAIAACWQAKAGVEPPFAGC